MLKFKNKGSLLPAIRKDGMAICTIEKDIGKLYYISADCNSDELRQIARKLDELNRVEPRIFGELWIDKNGKPNFQCHTKSEDFNEVRKALAGFIGLLQLKVDNQEKCPFSPHKPGLVDKSIPPA